MAEIHQTLLNDLYSVYIHLLTKEEFKIKQDACSGVHTGLKMATFVEGVMCSREVDRDTGGLDHINTTNKYNHD